MPGYAYEPLSSAGWIWNRTRAVGSLGRAYNYPHQAAVYWAAYRVARDADEAPMSRPALWYLRQAARTVQVACFGRQPHTCACPGMMLHAAMLGRLGALPLVSPGQG